MLWNTHSPFSPIVGDVTFFVSVWSSLLDMSFQHETGRINFNEKVPTSPFLELSRSRRIRLSRFLLHIFCLLRSKATISGTIWGNMRILTFQCVLLEVPSNFFMIFAMGPFFQATKNTWIFVPNLSLPPSHPRNGLCWNKNGFRAHNLEWERWMFKVMFWIYTHLEC